MTIRYTVVPSPFESGKFFVRTLPGLTYTLEEAIVAITQETALTESEVRGVASSLARLRDEALVAGRQVDFGELGRYTLRVRATLENVSDPLPPDYEVEMVADAPRQAASRLRDRVTVEREEVAAHQPTIQSFYDAATKQKDTYTAGAPARINGVFLEFDEQDAEQGVFLVAEGGAAVRADIYLTTGSKEVEFDVPPGLAGLQSVEVRTRRKEKGALLLSDPFGPLTPA